MPTLNVLVTFDFEEWEGGFSIYEADMYHKTQRVVETLLKKNAPATFFLDAYTVQCYPEAARLLDEKGFELALHSDYHPCAVRYGVNGNRALVKDIPDFRQDYQTQISRMNNGISMIRQVIPHFNPAGFRAPKLKWNNQLYIALKSLNFLYDSSQKVDQFFPFSVDGITVIPFNSGDYDSACYTLRPQYVFATWKDRLAKAYKFASTTDSPNPCFVLLLHPSVVGKTKYIGLLKAILNQLSWYKDVNYLSCKEFESSLRKDAVVVRKESPTEL